jgi:hypothetical protein
MAASRDDVRVREDDVSLGGVREGGDGYDPLEEFVRAAVLALEPRTEPLMPDPPTTPNLGPLDAVEPGRCRWCGEPMPGCWCSTRGK